MEFNFKQLAERYGRLRQHFSEDGSYNFHAPGATYDLTEAIMKDSFGLEIALDRTKLCPRIPNRVAYVRWCERLVQEQSCRAAQSRDGAAGCVYIDIGTGSSAIYPLLAERATALGESGPEHRFIGTELDEQSLLHAQKQIDRNKLQRRVQLVSADSECDILTTAVVAKMNLQEHETVRFTMCNPPFYQSAADLVVRAASKAERKNLLTASDKELIHRDGGEAGFIRKYIGQSLQLRESQYGGNFKTCWFTSQAGIYATCGELELELKQLQKSGAIRSFVIEEVPLDRNSKGSTTKRWIVAWTCSGYRYPVLSFDIPKQPLVSVYRELSKLEYCEVWYGDEGTADPASETPDSRSVYLRSEYPTWTRKFMRILNFNRAKLSSIPKEICIFRISLNRVFWVYGSDKYSWETLKSNFGATNRAS